jgi:hypothetical protein
LSGFVLADSQASAISGTPVWSTTAAADSQPGRYAIDGSGLTAMNYVFVEATANATALTVQAGSSPVIPPVIAPVTPPVIPPAVPPVIPPVTPPSAGYETAGLLQAEIAVGTLEADLPASQTGVSLSPPELASDIVLAPDPDSEQGAVSADLSTNGVDLDKRVVLSATVPSLRIERGGVKLPDNVVDVDAR